MKTYPILILSLLFAASGLMAGEHPARDKSEHPSKEKSEHPKSKMKAPVYGVIFHADWCPKCKTLGPKLSEVKPEYKKAGMKFIKFDFTNDETTAKSAKIAEKYGLKTIYDTHAGKTGFVLLVDGSDHEVLKTLTADQSSAELRESMGMAMAKAKSEKGSMKSDHSKKSEHPNEADHSEHPDRSEDSKKSEHTKGNEHPQ